MTRLLLAALLFAMPAIARTREVLVGTTATSMTPNALAGRQAVGIRNLGPNTIFCTTDVPVMYRADGITSTPLAVNVGWPIPPSEWRALQVPSSQQLFCIASALQVTGAATIVDEVY